MYIQGLCFRECVQTHTRNKSCTCTVTQDREILQVSVSVIFFFTLEVTCVRTHETGMHIHAHINHAYISIDTYRCFRGSFAENDLQSAGLYPPTHSFHVEWLLNQVPANNTLSHKHTHPHTVSLLIMHTCAVSSNVR